MCLLLKLKAAYVYLSLITFICTVHVYLCLPGGTAASRINRQLIIAQPQPIRRRLQRERSCTVTVASQWTARVCRSSKRRHKRRRRRRPTHSCMQQSRSVRSQAKDMALKICVFYKFTPKLLISLVCIFSISLFLSYLSYIFLVHSTILYAWHFHVRLGVDDTADTFIIQILKGAHKSRTA